MKIKSTDWWDRITSNSYTPMIYEVLTKEEKENMFFWGKEMDANKWTGQCGIPFMSLLLSLVDGSYRGKIVQLGHYRGYSTILTAMFLRKMNLKNSFISTDIKAEYTACTQRFISEFELDDYVDLKTLSSTNREFIKLVKDFGPQIVVIDSSHQYEQTKKELEIFYDLLLDGGLLFLHDTSVFAKQWDATEKGGVKRALDEFVDHQKIKEGQYININGFFGDGKTSAKNLEDLTYLDGCGCAIIQKC